MAPRTPSAKQDRAIKQQQQQQQQQQTTPRSITKKSSMNKKLGIRGDNQSGIAINPSTNVAEAKLKFANQTDRIVIFKISCDDPGIFKIRPNNYGLLRPQEQMEAMIAIGSGYNSKKSYQVVVRAAYINEKYVQQDVTANALWKRLEETKRTAIYAFMRVAILPNKGEKPVAEALLELHEEYIDMAKGGIVSKIERTPRSQKESKRMWAAPAPSRFSTDSLTQSFAKLPHDLNELCEGAKAIKPWQLVLLFSLIIVLIAFKLFK